jgi:predicted dehydrogenase
MTRNDRMTWRGLLALGVVLAARGWSEAAAGEAFRLGIIGLDTSHAVAFTKVFNAGTPPDDPGERTLLEGFRVVAATPLGSPDIVSSTSRREKITAEVAALGVEIVDSIDSLLPLVDGVLLETNDGRPHLAQARKVIAAGKPLFVDKPVAASLADVLTIYRLAEQANVPIFSSSTLRFAPAAAAVRAGSVGPVLGCDAASPCALEPTHPDLFWYGIHGVETLFTCMGTGCESVSRTHTPSSDLVVGRWSDGRIGSFRGMREGKQAYGGHAYGRDGTAELGPPAGYRPLVLEIARFFRSGKPPVSPEETIEIYAFMEAAHESTRRGGAEVRLDDLLERARQDAQATLDEPR